MLGFLFSRLISALLVIAGVVCLVFLLIHLIPGDPVEVMLGESARAADKQALRIALGLDQPLLTQALNYFSALLRGDLGNSLHSSQPVLDILLQRLPATAQLAAASLLVSISLALPAGIIAATHRGSLWDQGAMAFSMLGVSIPNFWMGPMLILVFSLWLGWFPVSGQSGLASLVLPAVTLGTALAAILSRMVRSAMLEVLQEDYIRTARAKGLPPRLVLLRHALRNAALPLITVLGLQLGVLLGVSIPNFWMGPMLILVFSLWLGWFPVSGQSGLASLVLPAVTLGTALAAILSRMVRSAMLEVLQEDYIRTARAKGLPPRLVLLRHALRNAALPLITVLGLQLGVLLGGAVITEVIFSWPGIGSLTIESIQRRDYPLVQGCILLISLSYVLVNTGTDLLYAWIDPRVRLAQE